MIIIFEGCDGTGKTTAIELCKKVAEEKFGFTSKVVHRGPPTTDDWFGLYLETDDLKGDEDIIFCDRWHWGECVYGPIFRGKNDLDGQREWLDKELARRDGGAVVVLLDGDDDVIENRVRTRGDDFIEVDHTREILARYREEFEKPTLISKERINLGKGFFTEEDAIILLCHYMF